MNRGLNTTPNSDALWYTVDGPCTALFRHWHTAGVLPIRFIAARGSALAKTRAHKPRQYWGKWFVPIELELVNQQAWADQHYTDPLLGPVFAVFD